MATSFARNQVLTSSVLRVASRALLALAIASALGRDQPPVARPRVAIVDVHTHLGSVDQWPGRRPNFDEIQRTMRDRHVDLVVDFKAPAPSKSLANGIFGQRVKKRLRMYPDTTHFALFANVPIDDERNRFLGDTRADYPQWIARILEDAVRDGASGLKMKIQAGPTKPKETTLKGSKGWTFDNTGRLLPFDTPAFDPLWSTAERLRVPVLLHLGGAYKGEHQEPKGRNRQVRWEVLMLERERVLRKHPRLMMIGAHFACTGGDLGYLDQLLDRYPNLVTEVGAHAPEDVFANFDPVKLSFLERHQDQIVFGSDYMENTFGWLKSYRQRLDMFLPFMEAWPLSKSVREKFYNRNALRLLHRSAANTAPTTHAGFTTTVIAGDRVTLDGSGSLDAKRDAIRYLWAQVDGTPVTLSSTTSMRPQFVAPDEGSYRFALTTTDGKSTGPSRTVLVNVLSRDQFFLEDSGRVVIEAEHPSSNFARNGQQWTLASAIAGYSGDGYLVASPQNGTEFIHAFRDSAPELRYKIWIDHPGTYVAYVRGLATDSGAAGVHLGLDNEEIRLADNVEDFSTGQWSWVRETRQWDEQFKMVDRNLAVLNVATPGAHVLNVWMERDGLALDKIVLVRIEHAEVSVPIFDPGSGLGGTESRRADAPSNGAR